MTHEHKQAFRKALRKQVAAFVSEEREKSLHSLEAASRKLGYATIHRLKAFESGAAPVPVCELYRMLVLYDRSADAFLDFNYRIQELIASDE